MGEGKMLVRPHDNSKTRETRVELPDIFEGQFVERRAYLHPVSILSNERQAWHLIRMPLWTPNA